jgi:hypothetical protein
MLTPEKRSWSLKLASLGLADRWVKNAMPVQVRSYSDARHLTLAVRPRAAASADGAACMEKLKQQSPDRFGRTFVHLDELRRQMSELISLRERVAQAELVARRYGPYSERPNNETSH